MGRINYQKDTLGNVIYPVTIGDAVAVNGETLTSITKDATTSKHGLMTAADKTKLNSIAAGAQVNTVTSVAGKTGAVTLAKGDVGLGNVGNFKAVSTVASQGLTSTEQSNARANIGAGTGSYSKPSTGIPKTDLASAVQTSLGKADTALQSHQDISGKLDKNTAITAGTNCKITYDANGLVTAGTTLAASDIPSLAASKITSGTFADDRIASAATWNAKQNALSFTGTPSSSNKVVTQDTLNAAVAGASNYLGTVTALTGLSTSAKKGDFYRVSTAWSGVHVGDIIIAEKNSPSQSVDGTNWSLLHNEINTDTHDTNVAGTGIAVSGTRGNTISLSSAVQTTLANADADHTNLGGHTVGKDVPSNAVFTDTTYSSRAAANGGTTVSLVTTGEKYIWNNKQNAINANNKLSVSLISGLNATAVVLGQDIASAINIGRDVTSDLSIYEAFEDIYDYANGILDHFNDLTKALTNNTTTYSDSKIAAIVDVAASDTTIQ